MKNKINLLAAVFLMASVIALAIYLPSLLLEVNTQKKIDTIYVEEKEKVAVYKYDLDIEEKLLIVSNALGSRSLPQSDYYQELKQEVNISEIKTQSYAFLSNNKENEYNEETISAAVQTLNLELSTLYAMGIYPIQKEIGLESYEPALFSAIDVLSPQKSVPLWQVDLKYSVSLTEVKNDLVSCLFDAESGKIYEFSVRVEQEAETYDFDSIMALWFAYLSVSDYTEVSDAEFVKDSEYQKNYYISDSDGNKIVYATGLYEGINEFYIKIVR